jgi:hypothetical protein
VETFKDRFAKVTEGMGKPEIMRLTGLSDPGINQITAGRTKSIKLDGGLRLCEKAGYSPYYLAGVPTPKPDMRVETDGGSFAIYATQLTGDLRDGRTSRRKIAEALRAASLKVDERVSLSEMTRPRPSDDAFDLPPQVVEAMAELVDRRLAQMQEQLQLQISQESKASLTELRKLLTRQSERQGAPSARRRKTKSP